MLPGYFFIMRNPDSHLDFDLDLAKQQSSDNPVYYVQILPMLASTVS